jgi:hypothetical protein
MLLRRGDGHARGHASKQHAAGHGRCGAHQAAVVRRVGLGAPQGDRQAALHRAQHGQGLVERARRDHQRAGAEDFFVQRFAGHEGGGVGGQQARLRRGRMRVTRDERAHTRVGLHARRAGFEVGADAVVQHGVRLGGGQAFGQLLHEGLRRGVILQR